MNKINAIIVDDERLARKELASMLAEFENVEIIGEADSVSSATELIKKSCPDVIFLDIQMPGESGFELANKTDLESKIIFVTAYDEYALRAFEVNALDYLMKPINPKRLKQAVDRIIDDSREKEDEGKQLQYDDNLFIQMNSKFRFIKVSSILSIKSAGDYSELIIANATRGLVLKSMKEWERRLPKKYFTRIHRSTIINMEYIDKIEDWFNNSYRVYIGGITEPFIISRRYAAKLKERFG
jgi:two-component system LytT family response regulator